MNQQSVDESLSNRKCTSLLISEASKLYCDLLAMAFYGVRERFHVVAAVSNTTETLAALREHSPQIAIISDTLGTEPWQVSRFSPRSAGSLLILESFWSWQLPITTW